MVFCLGPYTPSWQGEGWAWILLLVFPSPSSPSQSSLHFILGPGSVFAHWGLNETRGQSRLASFRLPHNVAF